MDSFSKCYTFGIRKNKTTTEQLQPYITIPQKLLLRVEKDKSFSNLGKYFNFKINSDEIKAKLKDKMTKLLTNYQLNVFTEKHYVTLRFLQIEMAVAFLSSN